MNVEIPTWVNEYVGIPYKTHGRDRDGCDCWGLLSLVWRERLGTPLPDYPSVRWSEDADAGEVGAGAASYASQFEPVALGSERLGDGILIRMRGHPLHVGLVLCPGWMLHTHESADSCIESFERFVWRSRILGIYRYKP